jgi:hypothetical protein
MGGPYLGIDPQGVETWFARLNGVHEQVIAALNQYRTVAQQNNEVAHGLHFQNLNSQCEEITNKHLADHNELHAQYSKESNDLVNAIRNITGG